MNALAKFSPDQIALINQLYPNGQGLTQEELDKLDELFELQGNQTQTIQYLNQKSIYELQQFNSRALNSLSSPEATPVDRYLSKFILPLIQHIYTQKGQELRKQFINVPKNVLQENLQQMNSLLSHRNIIGNETIANTEFVQRILQEILNMTPEQLAVERAKYLEPQFRQQFENMTISRLEALLQEINRSFTTQLTIHQEADNLLKDRLIRELLSSNYLPEAVRLTESQTRATFSGASIDELQDAFQNFNEQLQSPQLTPIIRARYQLAKQIIQQLLQSRQLPISLHTTTIDGNSIFKFPSQIPPQTTVQSPTLTFPQTSPQTLPQIPTQTPPQTPPQISLPPSTLVNPPQIPTQSSPQTTRPFGLQYTPQSILSELGFQTTPPPMIISPYTTRIQLPQSPPLQISQTPEIQTPTSITELGSRSIFSPSLSDLITLTPQPVVKSITPLSHIVRSTPQSGLPPLLTPQSEELVMKLTREAGVDILGTSNPTIELPLPAFSRISSRWVTASSVLLILQPYLEIFPTQENSSVTINLPLIRVNPSVNRYIFEEIKNFIQRLKNAINPLTITNARLYPQTYIINIFIYYSLPITPQTLLTILNEIKSLRIPLFGSVFTPYHQTNIRYNIVGVDTLLDNNYFEVDLKSLGFI